MARWRACSAVSRSHWVPTQASERVSSVAGAAGDLGGGVAVDGAGEDVGQHRHRCAVDPLGVVVVGGVLADHVEGVGVGAAAARHVHPGAGGALVDQAVAGVDGQALRAVGGDRVGQRRVLLDVVGGEVRQDPVAVADGQGAGQPVAADDLVDLAVGDRAAAVDPQGVVVAAGLDQVSDRDEVAVAGLGEHLGRDPPGATSSARICADSSLAIASERTTSSDRWPSRTSAR